MADDRTAKKIAEKIHKLLKLAQNQEGTPEGDNAAAAARRLMRQYQIDQGMVEDAGDPLVEHRVKTPQVNRWRRELAAGVAYYCECYVLWTIGTPTVRIFGRRSATLVAADLFDRIQSEIDRRCDAYAKEVRERVGPDYLAGGQWRSLRERFSRDAALVVRQRLRKMLEGEQRADAKGHELVVHRCAEAENHAKAKVAKIKTADPLMFAGSRAGQQAGQEINLGRSIRTEDGVQLVEQLEHQEGGRP